MDDPYDPSCRRYAADMEELDFSWPNSQEELDACPMEGRPAERIIYVLREEGTLNRANNHFLCDQCYILAGMPTAPGGWVCP